MDEFVRDAHNAEYYGGDHDDGDRLTFSANLAPVASAIKVDGNGAGRVQFDVPETDRAAILWMIARCPGSVLELTVRVKDGGE